ncbi:MAG TPA: hypothetical protein VID48_05930 [Solirubrobacteraceae bacterium]|jgi:hypothetical protein
MLGLITLFASVNPSVTPYLFGLVSGFLIGGFGHLIKSPAVIVLGIVLIGVTTAAFVLVSDPSAP